MKAWFIIGPKGSLFVDGWGQCRGNLTRKGCIDDFLKLKGYKELIGNTVWNEHVLTGYRCERREIVG